MKPKIYSNLKNNKVGPLWVVTYLIIVGAISFAFRAGFNSNVRYSYLILTTEILVLSLYFFIILIIYRILAKRIPIDYILQNTMSFYWLLALTPLITGLSGEAVSNTRLISVSNLLCIQNETGIVLSFVVMISFLFCYRIFTYYPTVRNGLKYSSLAFTTSLVFSIPTLFIRRVVIQDSKFLLYAFIQSDLLSSGGLPSIQQPTALLINQGYHLNLVLILIEISVIVSVLLYLTSKNFFTSLFKNLKPFRTLHFIMLVIIGVIVVRKVSPDYVLDPLALNHFPFVFIAVFCSAFFVWQFTSLLNDLYDVTIDKLAHPDRPLVIGHGYESVYFELCIAIIIVSSWLTLLLGPLIFALNTIAIATAVIYSVPPIRLRSRAFGHICIGLGSVIALLVGVYSPTRWVYGIVFNDPYHMRNIPFYPEILQIAILLFIVLSISPLINAISDYEGDLSSGVKNVYTVYGFERGKKIVSILIVLLFLSPLLMFQSVLDIILLTLAAMISSIIFYKKEKWRILFGLYFLILIYCMFRFLEFI